MAVAPLLTIASYPPCGWTVYNSKTLNVKTYKSEIGFPQLFLSHQAIVFGDTTGNFC